MLELYISEMLQLHKERAASETHLTWVSIAAKTLEARLYAKILLLRAAEA